MLRVDRDALHELEACMRLLQQIYHIMVATGTTPCFQLQILERIGSIGITLKRERGIRKGGKTGLSPLRGKDTA